jgi:hypothetical protein
VNLPENLKKSIQVRLDKNHLLSAVAIAEILKALEEDSVLNWNLILNREITKNTDDETQD